MSVYGFNASKEKVNIFPVDYSGLTNKPSINGVSLSGNKTGVQLKVCEMPDYSYASQSKGDSFTINRVSGGANYMNYDVQVKGLYKIVFHVAGGTPTASFKIGTTALAFNADNAYKFYTIDYTETAKNVVYFLPLDVGDRVGLYCGAASTLASITATCIPMKGV